jgi:hypothetical protein
MLKYKSFLLFAHLIVIMAWYEANVRDSKSYTQYVNPFFGI